MARWLALRLLIVHEGKWSAETPDDTWVYAGRPGAAEMVRPLLKSTQRREEIASAQ